MACWLARSATHGFPTRAGHSWAFAKACHYDEQLFTALASSAVRCIEDFNVQDLVNTAWAYAKVGQCDAELFLAAARSITGQHLDDLSAVYIANIAYAVARLQPLPYFCPRASGDGGLEGSGVAASHCCKSRGHRRADGLRLADSATHALMPHAGTGGRSQRRASQTHSSSRLWHGQRSEGRATLARPTSPISHGLLPTQTN